MRTYHHKVMVEQSMVMVTRIYSDGYKGIRKKATYYLDLLGGDFKNC